MRNALLFLAILAAGTAAGQDTLFTESFQAAPWPFTLNSTGAGSTASGYNHWVVNSQYAGGPGSGTVCGIPVTFTVPSTAAQPGGIAGTPNSAYLHTVSDLSVTNGISNCCFLAADGFCNFDENYFAAMNTDLNTTGYDTVSVAFWWLCAGGNNSYGELYYSTNGGVSWTKQNGTAKYNNTASWTHQAVTDPAFAQQAQLRFGFRFVNAAALSASDPGFGIDDILVTGVQNAVLPVAAFTASAVTFCEETCIDFTDLSANMPTAWQWLFPGAVPDTSTLQNPQMICYSDTGFFDVTLIVSNAQGTDTLTLANYIHSIANPPQPVITVNGDTLCTAFSPGYGYQWYFSATTVIPGAVNSCYVAIFPGSYSVEITDTTGCKSLSDPVLVTGIGEEGSRPDDRFTVLTTDGAVLVLAGKGLNTPVVLSLIDARGRLAGSGTLQPGGTVLLAEQARGLFILQAGTGRKSERVKVAVK